MVGQVVPQNLMDAINRVPSIDIKYFIEQRKCIPGYNVKMVEVVTVENIPDSDLRLVSLWLRDSKQMYAIAIKPDYLIDSIGVVSRTDCGSFVLQRNIFVFELSKIKFNVR